MVEQNTDHRDLIESVYQTHFYRNSLVGLLGCVVFFFWSFFDYILEEPEFFTFFLIRLFILLIFSIVFLFRKTSWYYHNHIKVNSFILTLLVISLLYFTTHSPNPISHFGGIGFIFLTYPVIGVSEIRYLIPMVITVSIGLAYQHQWLVDLPFVIRISIIFYGLTSLFFSILGLHLRFRAAMANEESNMKVKEGRIKLVKGNDERKKLLRVMSHDLSNSLVLIQASTMQLRRYVTKNELPSKLIDYIDRIEKASQFQQEVIEHVRMNEALKGGKIQVNPTCVHFNDVLKRATVLFEDRFKKKNVTLETNLEKEDMCFIADEVAFSNHVFNNIISNALKFSFENSKIIVSAKVVDEDVIEISVQDFGIGMEPSLIAVLFDSDKRTSRIGTSGEKGTGFGMPLLKTYVELFGGEVVITSKVKSETSQEQGTTITLRLKYCYRP